MNPVPKLLQPRLLRGVRLRNRIVIAPMQQYVAVDGHAIDRHLVNLGRLSEGGAGLVLQEGTTVKRSGRSTLGDLGIWDDEFLPGLTRLAASMRDAGTVPGIQIMHAGAKARSRRPMDGRGPLEESEVDDWDSWAPQGPSELRMNGAVTPARPMTTDDIDGIIRSFADAARRALQAGYEVLEIHAAHGYLLHQFLSPVTNRRDDAYGGELAGRSRLLLEAVDAIRAIWPSELPLLVRLSCDAHDGWAFDDTVVLARDLSRHGVDVIDCSAGGIGSSPLNSDSTAPYGYQVHLSEAVRSRASVETIAVGAIVRAQQAADIIESGQSDFVAIGREAMVNPHWPLYCAMALGAKDPWSLTTPESAYWLRQRSRKMPGLRSSFS